MHNDTFAHRRAFYLLKKYSSYTWGQEIFRLTKQFADEMEKILRNPPPSFTPVIDIDEMFLRTCWHYCGDLEEGLAFLLQGDKAVGYRKYGDGMDFASSALQGDPDRGAASRYICNLTTQKKYMALGYANDYGKVSTGIFALLEQAQLLSGYVDTTLHSQNYLRYWSHPEEINNRYWPSPVNKNVIETVFPLPRWHPAQLPPVPQPAADAPVIMSGDEVPVTGIWQPEIVDPMTEKEKQAWEITSENFSMNFLIQGNEAPKMLAQELFALWFAFGAPNYYKTRPAVDIKRVRRPVRWRLLWADDRYGKHGIPAEEQDYLRTDPPPAPMPAPALRAKAGEPCPQAGFWFTPAKMNSRRYFKQDEVMPVIGSDYGSTIWQWDQNQDMPKL